MVGYIVFSVVYLFSAVVAVELVHGNGVEIAIGSVKNFATMMPRGGRLTLGLALLVICGAITMIQKGSERRAGLAVVAGRFVLTLAATVLVMAAFSLWKTLLPQIVPFYADAMLADLDRWMHGGTDPWVWTQVWAEFLPMHLAETFYLEIWTIGALMLPAFIVAQDPDRDRVRRFMTLYLVAWVGLGNVIALAGMSAGPVYFERLLGDSQFAGLNGVLSDPGYIAPGLSLYQDTLWQLYVDGEQILASGISAFPSVHVGVATLFMLYAFERLRVLAPFMVGFLVVIQFLSVFTGYHYAVDGYFSILAVTVTWSCLRYGRRMRGWIISAGVEPGALAKG